GRRDLRRGSHHVGSARPPRHAPHELRLGQTPERDGCYQSWITRPTIPPTIDNAIAPMIAAMNAPPPKSGGKPPTVKSMPPRFATDATSSSMTALMTKPNKPSVMNVNGSENIDTMGFTSPLISPAITARISRPTTSPWYSI